MIILKPGWIAMDSDRNWYWFPNKPTLRDRDWNNGGVCYRLNYELYQGFPENACWRKSLRKVEEDGTLSIPAPYLHRQPIEVSADGKNWCIRRFACVTVGNVLCYNDLSNYKSMWRYHRKLEDY